MELIDYVVGVHEKNQYPKTFPPDLVLPKPLVDVCRDLYNLVEREGCESGQSISLNNNRTIVFSAIARGTDVSCDVPHTDNPWEFGDVHSHPSKAIGHLNGYSAHSMEDWTTFKYNENKPIFIRFVSSGDFIYAVVYRRGYSTYDKAIIDDRLTQNLQFMHEIFDKYYPRHYSEEVLDLDENEEKRKKIEQKLAIKGFGEQVMEKSLEHNIYLAENLNFGFYKGHRKETKDVLFLEAGRKGI
ncbi:hypothetical protein WA1_14650 [Scytonema hofmannii PCC 7110]|uniref:Uncharacterized protein n=1 Tax=Scytonema hofmannii PCC 7110 TaxID=128403 RepID=A0A139XF45_9CYAN|nr:hypothetical protein [Scytonema hofmannii]KYC43320.1 hypothetical protein WA1_14650 [Scytonema hofmannii PCC 7110]